MAKQHAFYEYKSVEGIDDSLLDACLLLLMDKEDIINKIKKEKYFLARTGIPVKRLMKKEIEKPELIRSLSPYLKDRLEIYNILVNMSGGLLQKVYLEELEEDTPENIFHFLKGKFHEKELPYGLFINWLRFRDEYHSFIQEVLEECGTTFQQETGISLPEHFSVKEEEADSFSAELDEIIESMERLKKKAASTDFTQKYEEEKAKNEQLLFERDQAVKDYKSVANQIKSKEQLLAKKEKEVTQLKKKLDAETGALKKRNKETGQIAAELGELRKELADVSNDCVRFKREAENAKLIKEAALKDQEERLTQKLHLEHALVLDSYKNQLDNIERDNERLYKQVETIQKERQEHVKQQEEIEQLKAQLLLYEKHFAEEGRRDRDTSSSSEVNQEQEKSVQEGWGELEKLMVQAGQNEPTFSS